MARRKKKSAKKNQFVINKYKLGGGLIAIGFLYFFAYFLAQESPLLEFFNTGAYLVFGEVGTFPFFLCLVILGLVFIFRGYLIKTLTKQFVLVMFFLSAIFNFSLLDTGNALLAGEEAYTDNGGYLSYPLLWVMDAMFGSTQTLATKSLIIILFIGVCVRMFFTLNVKEVLPTLPTISLKNYTAPDRSSNNDTSSKKSKKKFEKISQTDLKQKLEEKLLASTITQQEPEKNISDTPSHTSSGSIFKSIFASDVKKKVAIKIQENTLKKIPFPQDKPTFPTEIMDMDTSNDGPIDNSYLVAQAEAIQNKLMEFNVPVSIEGFDIGPSIVQLRVKPDAGIKVSSIENLKNDLALSVKSPALRIEAPILGTSCVGIQLPNPKPRMVYLGDVLKSPEFRQAMQKSTTNLAMGVGIDGGIIVKQLEKMPHLLVAGATGSGKSVGVNDFILSLIFQNSPSELKFLMVDPKQVELEFYSGLPYLLAPIVTQSDKALKLLQRSVEEMETRYSKLKKTKVKNLTEFNEKHPEEAMYRIVIVIDELADLMMTGNKKDVEGCITRIAQKARAVGMHLIVATQRPSVNVLTGLIKANVPTRVAFGVVSQIDSRTILGFKGAEDLLGRGDMLYSDPQTKNATRIQAPFVSTAETERIMAHLKDKYMQGLAEDEFYHPEIIRMLEGQVEYAGVGGSSSGSGGGNGSDDELIEQAIQVISETRKASATMLQRKLNVGFARAARIMDELEERGIVGPQEGAKARDILI